MKLLICTGGGCCGGHISDSEPFSACVVNLTNLGKFLEFLKDFTTNHVTCSIVYWMVQVHCVEDLDLIPQRCKTNGDLHRWWLLWWSHQYFKPFSAKRHCESGKMGEFLEFMKNSTTKTVNMHNSLLSGAGVLCETFRTYVYCLQRSNTRGGCYGGHISAWKPCSAYCKSEKIGEIRIIHEGSYHHKMLDRMEFLIGAGVLSESLSTNCTKK